MCDMTSHFTKMVDVKYNSDMHVRVRCVEMLDTCVTFHELSIMASGQANRTNYSDLLLHSTYIIMSIVVQGHIIIQK